MKLILRVIPNGWGKRIEVDKGFDYTAVLYRCHLPLLLIATQ